MLAALIAAINRSCSIYNELPSAVNSIASGAGTRDFCTNSTNEIIICAILPNGNCAAYIAPDDVRFTATNTQCAAPRVQVEIRPGSKSGSMHIAYSLAGTADVPAVAKMHVRVYVCGVLLVDACVTRKGFNGRAGGALHSQHAFVHNCGSIAIHPAATHLAASYSDYNCVHVYALPEFRLTGVLV